MSYIVGVDVGGTNTDAAIVSANTVVGWFKASTTDSVIEGLLQAIQGAIANAIEQGCDEQQLKNNIARIHIGTTHFINAVIKRKSMGKVACIRLCGFSSHAIPPFSEIPEDLRCLVDGGSYLLRGGFEYNEQVIDELNVEQIVETIQKIKTTGAKHIAVCGIFSPTNTSQELAVRDLIVQHYPSCTVTMSHELGPLGLLERENASILNEALKALCVKTIADLKSGIEGIGLQNSVFFTQNDGTLISESEVRRYPVYTFSSGATNSMRGAAHLSSLKNAVIVDIGGTSTDVGNIVNGFPRDSSTHVEVGGVNTNFRMPDTKSFGLGGGSIVKMHDNQLESIGPESVEYRIRQESLVFGGSTLVSTDIAVANGNAVVGDTGRVGHLDKTFVESTMKMIRQKVEAMVDTVKIASEDCNIVLVGGGSILIDPNEKFRGASQVVKPKYYQVANAVGAALSQVSGTFDKLVNVSEDRDQVIQAAKKEAVDIAVRNGAVPDTCYIAEVETMSMSYMVVPCIRLKVKAIGELRHAEILFEEKGTTDSVHLSNIGRSTEVEVPAPTIDHPAESKACTKDLTLPPQISTANPPLNTPTTKLSNNTAPFTTTSELSKTPGDEWRVSEYDAECLAVGAGILGCGGGGSPRIGLLGLKQLIKEGKQPRIISPQRMDASDEGYCMAYMGAPDILIERLPNGKEFLDVLSLQQRVKRLGFHEDMNREKAIELLQTHKLDEVQTEDHVAFLVKDLKSEAKKIDKSNKVVIPAEIGGMNALEPLMVAARLDIPCVDCDGVGRAFPQLQQFLPFVYGKPPYPAVIASHKGEGVCCVHSPSATGLEALFRQCCVKFGCAAAVCLSALTKDDVMQKMCLGTLTEAWRIGDDIFNARKSHHSPVDALLEITRGKLLVTGKITEVVRDTKVGFTRGKISIKANDDQTCRYFIKFQNEYLIAWRNEGDTPENILATCPDLISIVETDSGEPVTSDEVKYGLRVSVVCLPATPLMKTPDALKYVAPHAFGYTGIDYQPL